MAKSLTEIESLARSHSDNCVRVLAGIMNQDKAPASSRVAAAEALLSRGWGKPVQKNTHSGDDDGPPVKHTVTWEFITTHKDERDIPAPGEEGGSV